MLRQPLLRPHHRLQQPLLRPRQVVPRPLLRPGQRPRRLAEAARAAQPGCATLSRLPPHIIFIFIFIIPLSCPLTLCQNQILRSCWETALVHVWICTATKPNPNIN